MADNNKDFQKAASPSVAPYEDVTSPIFIDRYGQTHDSEAVPKHTKVRLGVFSVICAHGQILLNFPPWAKECAELPGGGVRAHETIETGLLRELEEETGLQFDAVPDESKANEYYMNLYAEDVDTYIRYIQKFYYFDLSDVIPKDKLKCDVTEEGSAGFWQPLDKLDELQMRFGHEHIIREAALHQCKPDNISELGAKAVRLPKFQP